MVNSNEPLDIDFQIQVKKGLIHFTMTIW
jgi:hypothetical protein